MRLICAGLLGLALCSSRAESPIPAVPPPPTEPGIFGIGFTNVTGTSARLVFTTSEPMKASVGVSGNGGMFAHDSFDEIHAFEIGGLTGGKDFSFTVFGVTKGGRTVTAEGIRLRPSLRPASTHRWPGYTIFGTTIVGDDEEAYKIAVESGVRMARIEPSWYGILPNGREIDPAYRDQLLRQVALLKKYHIEPLVILDYCVPWAKPYTNTTMTWRHPSFGPPDRLEDWEYYVRTVVKLLDGSARYYEVWNEPDAGYLGTGSYVERPGLPAPIGREPFKDNWAYWLGDRYAPMVARVRAVMDEIQPGAILLNGGWNRDYSGQRGDLLFQRGMAPYLDAYAYHTYCPSPMSFSRWYQAIDGGFRSNIDRIFKKHGVDLPLAVTEWGWPAWSQPNPEKGFVTFRDAQIFYVKSAFYFLSLQRVEMLSQFLLGVGSDSRDKDPLFFMLVNRGAGGGLVRQPTLRTFGWLASTFGSRPYRSLPVKVGPDENTKAYAIELEDSRDIYLAVWQDGVADDKGAIPPLPAKTVEVRIDKIPPGKYAVSRIDLEGGTLPQKPVDASAGLVEKLSLPEASSTAESEPVLLKLSPETPSDSPHASR